jgi:hypothetical protein
MRVNGPKPGKETLITPGSGLGEQVTSIDPRAQDSLASFIKSSKVPEALFVTGVAFWITKIWLDRIHRRIIRRGSHNRREGFSVVLKKDNSEKRK